MLAINETFKEVNDRMEKVEIKGEEGMQTVMNIK